MTTGALLSQLLPAPEELGGPSVALPAAPDRGLVDLLPGPAAPAPAPGAPSGADPGAGTPPAPADQGAGAGASAPPAAPSGPGR
ncbi:hypothetical protein ACFU9E_23335, partial [Kitasatospora sp. NPDC057595]